MFTKSAVALALVGSAAAFTGPTAMPLRTGVSSPLIQGFAAAAAAANMG
jgi:hypothetical protein